MDERERPQPKKDDERVQPHVVDNRVKEEAWIDRMMLAANPGENRERLLNIDHQENRLELAHRKASGGTLDAAALESEWAGFRASNNPDGAKDLLHRAYIEDVNLAYAAILERARRVGQGSPPSEPNRAEPPSAPARAQDKAQEFAEFREAPQATGERVTDDERRSAAAEAAERIARGTVADPRGLPRPPRDAGHYMNEVADLASRDAKLAALVERDAEKLKQRPERATPEAIRQELDQVAAKREEVRESDPDMAGKLNVRALALAKLHAEREAERTPVPEARPLPMSPPTRLDEQAQSDLADRVVRFTAARGTEERSEPSDLFVESPSGLLRREIPATREVTGSMVVEARESVRPPPPPEDSLAATRSLPDESTDRGGAGQSREGLDAAGVYQPTPVKFVRVREPSTEGLVDAVRSESPRPVEPTQNIPAPRERSEDDLGPRTPVVFIRAAQRNQEDSERTLPIPRDETRSSVDERAMKQASEEFRGIAGVMRDELDMRTGEGEALAGRIMDAIGPGRGEDAERTLSTGRGESRSSIDEIAMKQASEEFRGIAGAMRDELDMRTGEGEVLAGRIMGAIGRDRAEEDSERTVPTPGRTTETTARARPVDRERDLEQEKTVPMPPQVKRDRPFDDSTEPLVRGPARDDALDLSPRDLPRPTAGLAELSNVPGRQMPNQFVMRPESSVREQSSSDVFRVRSASPVERVGTSQEQDIEADREALIARMRAADPRATDDQVRGRLETAEAQFREKTNPMLSRPDFRQSIVEGVRERHSPHDAAERIFPQLTHEAGLAIVHGVKPYEPKQPVLARQAELRDDPALRSVPATIEALASELARPRPDRVEVAALAEHLGTLQTDLYRAGDARRAKAEEAVRALPEPQLAARIADAARVLTEHPSAGLYTSRRAAFLAYEGGRLTPGRETREAIDAYAVIAAAGIDQAAVRGTAREVPRALEDDVRTRAATMTPSARVESYWQARLTAELAPRVGGRELADAWSNVVEDLENEH